MSGADPTQAPVDEFDWIARELRPLAAGAPEAFDLLDDAAAIASRPGFDLIVSKDAIVEGVHFLPNDPLDLVARKLLRVNLSDLAAKGASPHGYLLSLALPPSITGDWLQTFAAGLAQDFSPTAHLLVRLRVLHPLLALCTSLYVAVAVGILAMQPQASAVRWDLR